MKTIWYWIKDRDWLAIGLMGIIIIAIGMLAFSLAAFIVQGLTVAAKVGVI